MKQDVNMDKGKKGEEMAKQRRIVDNKKAGLIIGIVVLIIVLVSSLILNENNRSLLDSTVGIDKEKLAELIEVDGVIEISTAEQLAALRDKVNTRLSTCTGDYSYGEHYEGKTIKLTADIDLKDYSKWEPIGKQMNQYYGYYFSGNFDGNGFKIKNMEATGGLFGYIVAGEGNTVTIKNLGIDSSCNITGNSYAGGIVSYVGDPNETSRYNGSVQIIECYNEAKIVGNCVQGGLVGGIDKDSSVHIERCYNSGSNSGGGFIGSSQSASIIDCYNRGQTSEGFVSVNYGGLSITNSYNVGKVDIAEFVGGGDSSSKTTLTNCYYLNQGNATENYRYGEVGLESDYMADIDGGEFLGKLNKNNCWKYTPDYQYPVLKWQKCNKEYYIVNHYKQDSLTSSQLVETERLSAAPNTEIMPTVKNYVGYKSPNKQTITINPTTTTQVYYYYMKECTITYNTNGGTGGPTLEKAYVGDEYTISNQVPTKDGYNFQYWTLDKGSYNNQYKVGDKFTVRGEETLRAVWKKLGNWNENSLPDGCEIKEGEDEKVDEEIVIITDGDGNEFVWIPVDQTSAIAKENLIEFISGETVGRDSMTNEFKASIEKYGGFYIARYEAGVGTTSGDNEGVPVSKKNVPVWNNISYSKAKRSAEKMYENKEDASTELINGFAWDTVCQLLEKYNYNVRSNEAGWGNIATETTDDYGDWIWNSGDLQKTGSNDGWQAYCIYDFLGNVSEWTTEEKERKACTTWNRLQCRRRCS